VLIICALCVGVAMGYCYHEYFVAKYDWAMVTVAVGYVLFQGGARFDSFWHKLASGSCR